MDPLKFDEPFNYDCPVEFISEPIQLHYHNTIVGKELADFAFETMAKKLKINTKTYHSDTYYIGYFFSTQEEDDQKSDVSNQLDTGVKLLRLFMKNKGEYISEPEETDCLPLKYISIDLFKLDIFTDN